MALNHMHASLNKIVLYNDKIVLEEEYNNIINNLNLTVIKDSEIVNVITYLMDTLTSFKLTEMEKEQFQREYQEKLDNAISGALMGLSVSGTTPQQMALSLVMSAGSAYMTYKEGQKSAKKGFDKNKWGLKKDTISELNEIRKDFLLTYWKIMKRYNMPDKWRITEKQFTRFITILKGNDINKKYRQLLRMKEEMSLFPTYWYELSLVLHKLNKKDDELKAISEYEILNDKLLRHNSYYSLMLANKTSYYNYKTESEKIINILNKIYDIDPLNAERKLFIAMKYQQMGYTKKAEKLLNENIDDNFLPVLSQRLKANMYLKDKRDKDYENTISSLLKNQNLSASDYLFYLGKRPLPLLIAEIEKQIKEIKIVVEKTLYGNDDLYVWLPKQWVFKDIEDTELIIKILDKEYKFTEISKEDGFIVYYYEGIIIKDDLLSNKVTNIDLKLIHKNMPIEISYNINVLSKKEEVITENNTSEEKKDSYWGIAKDFATGGAILIIAKDQYNNYKTSFEFNAKTITAKDKCFDLNNSLEPCK
ncbi:MAG: hypothetical protein U9Q30_10450 [Campylobacterota bacterium]|nr:hypothetical protein [Campylobacterota bacterium]